MKPTFLTIFLLITFFFFSCTKHEKKPVNILTSKTWKRGIQDKNPSTNPRGKVLYYAVPNCEKDDDFKFSQDGKLVINRNTDKCDPNESPIKNTNYTLIKGTKEFVMDGTKYTLAKESGSQIKYYASIPTGTGYEYLIFLLQ